MDKADIKNIMMNRHSVRAFTQQKVSKEIIEEILLTASRAPSASNIQPWNVYVVTGEIRDLIVEKVCEAYDNLVTHPNLKVNYKPAFGYYPKEWFFPYKERRRKNGWGLYEILGIEKKDRAKIIQQQRRNFMFFDAPVGLFLTVHKDLGTGSKMDIAMLMQNILLMAKAKGLDTCPQAAWNDYQSIVLPLINAQQEEQLVCTIALGYADNHAKVNTYHTSRLALNEFTHWLGFEEQ